MIKLLLYVDGPWLPMDYYKSLDNKIIDLIFYSTHLCYFSYTHGSVTQACPNSPSLSLANYEAILYSGSLNTLRNNTLGSHLHRVHHTDFTFTGYTLHWEWLRAYATHATRIIRLSSAQGPVLTLSMFHNKHHNSAATVSVSSSFSNQLQVAVHTLSLLCSSCYPTVIACTWCKHWQFSDSKRWFCIMVGWNTSVFHEITSPEIFPQYVFGFHSLRTCLHSLCIKHVS